MVRTLLALLGLLAAIVLGAPAPASASDATTDGSVTFGTQWWDQTAKEAKFQEFSEEPRGAFLDKYAVRTLRDRNLLLFYGDHALRHDQSNSLTWWNGAKVRLDLGYQEIPHNLSFITKSPFSEVAPGVLLLPDSLQAGNQAIPANYPARMRDALNSAPRIGMGFRTDITRARLRARPQRDLQFEIKGSRRMRSGRKPYGGGWSPGSGVEIWEPIAQRILDGEGRATYLKNRAAVTASAGVSEFHNEVNELIFDNPATLTGAQRLGGIDLPPNNRAVRANLGVVYQLPMHTAFNGTVGVSRNTQNDPWLPFTVNPSSPYSRVDSLPPERSTHGKVDVFTQDYRITSRLRKDLGGSLNFRQYEYRNRTPAHVFSGSSVADAAFTPGALETDVFGYRHQSYGGEVNYTPMRQVSLIGTADRTDRTRSVREVTSDREEAVGGKLHLRPTSKISVDGNVKHSKRWARNADFSYDGEEQTTLRRFDVADRNAMQAGGGFTITPNERFEVGASFGYLFEKYSDDLADTASIGLRRNHQRNASGDVTFHANPNLDLTATVGWEQLVSRQASRQSRTATFGTADSTWTARFKDEGLFGSIGVDWRAKPDLLGFSANFEYSRFPSTLEFATVSPSTITAQNPPGIKYRRVDLTLESDYNLADKTQLGLQYMWEEFDVTDFTTVDIPLLGIASGANSINYLYLGDSFQSYKVHQVALLVRQTF
jgi:MtrB/PioB family decaheme-associated outer membrane protein